MLIGDVQVQPSPARRRPDGGHDEYGEMARKFADLNATVIDLSALVREQATELLDLRQMVQQLPKGIDSGNPQLSNGRVPAAPVEVNGSMQPSHSDGHQFRATYIGRERVLVRTQTGQLLLCNAQDIQLTPQLLDQQVWHPAMTRFYIDNIAPGMKYLDIGANIGYFTVLAASLVGHTGRVHAFEPEPSAFSLLQINCRLNLCSYWCELARVALADNEGTRMLHSFQHNFGSSSLSDLPQPLLAEFMEQSTAQAVQCTTLDGYYSGRDILFDIIKIDAEGAEPLIFSGADEFLSRCTHDGTIFLVEFNPQAIKGLGHDGREFVSQLIHRGYFVWQLSPNGTVSSVAAPEALDRWCNAELILTRKAGSLETLVVART